jgi:cytochrome c-type biogenesis protein CcmH/NrfF
MKHGFALILLVLAAPAAGQDSGTQPVLANEQLSDPAQETAATQLMENLRCIQCQGQSIADSDAPIAAAMRSEVRVRIQKGESADSIRAWMISRYGAWISFDPPMSGGTALLWMTPIILLVAGLWMARGLFRKPQT